MIIYLLSILNKIVPTYIQSRDGVIRNSFWYYWYFIKILFVEFVGKFPIFTALKRMFMPYPNTAEKPAGLNSLSKFYFIASLFAANGTGMGSAMFIE